MRRRLRLSRTSPRGQSLVEFALVIPLIVLLIFGVLDLGRAVYVFNTLSESARQAVRMAIVNQDEGDIKATAVDFAPALGLSPGDITVCFKSASSAAQDCSFAGDECGGASGRDIGCLAIVTSSTTFSPITPLISSLVPPISLSATSVGPIEAACPNSSTSNCD